MSAPKNIVDDHKRPVSLLKTLGRGGEGTVYEIQGAPTRAAKIYLPEKAIARRDKIFAMIQAEFYKSTSNVAYPISPLFQTDGTFAGFTMEKVGGRKPVHELYSPSSRKKLFVKADFRFLVRAALNISHSIAAVHSTGCVVGDLNHSGILVSQEATASLIDADSFQFRRGNEIYRCTVGVPDFTPPELQGIRLDQVERTENHDIFGLAVVIFNLLFMGRHPFVGGLRGGGDMPMERAIAEYRFAYSNDRARTRMDPPPYVPSLSDLPPALANAFEATFSPSSSRANRPSATDWYYLLKGAEAEIVRCSSSPAHYYFKAASSCPWCRMERGFPGFLAFATPLQFNNTAPADLSQLIAAIRAVPDPGVGPSLIACMPVISTVASKAPLTNDGATSFVAATMGALISIPLFTTQAIPPALAFCSFAGCAFVALRTQNSNLPVRKQSEILRSRFQKYDEGYRNYIDNRKFTEIRTLAEAEILQLGGLGSEQAKLVAELSRKIRDAQMQSFLEKYRLIHVKIKGIGDSRKATLRSYGIETAADISKVRIEAISGFGPAASALLVGWRNTLEKKFIFNPAQPINPNDVARIRASIDQKRSQIEKNLHAKLIELQNVSSEIKNGRSSIVSNATDVWKNLKQAEADEKVIASSDKTTSRRWLFGLASALALIVSGSINSNRPTPPSSQTSAQQTPAPSTLPTAHPPQSPPASLPMPKTQITPAAKLPVSSGANPLVAPTPLPLPPPIEISKLPTPPDVTADLPHPTEDPSNSLTTTKRLVELGYLPLSQTTNPTRIKQAVKDFKIVNHLAANDDLDDATVRIMKSDAARSPNESFIGGWSTDEACSQGVQIEISSAQAKAEGGICKFNRFLSGSNGWKIQARCQVGAESWPANITLNLAGRQLSWASEKGQQSYYRCR